MIDNFKEVIRKAIRKSFTYAPDTMLAKSKAIQIENFKEAVKRFSEILALFNSVGCEKYILNTWGEYNRRFFEMCSAGLPINFLQHPIVRDTLAANPVLKKEWKPFLADLKREAPPFFLAALEEELIGSPRIVCLDPLTSPGRIVHGWTLLQFLKATNAVKNCVREDLENIVEYGGGYGGLCVIWKRLNPQATYTIIDTPIMLTIQCTYLTSIFGEDRVNALKTQDDIPVKGMINLMPVAFIDRNDLDVDVFVSTWALSESGALAQETIIGHDWYHAKHLLLAFQRASSSFPYAESFKDAAILRGGGVCELPYVFEGDSSAIFV
jgi:putative sugar O-methyltransferase